MAESHEHTAHAAAPTATIIDHLAMGDLCCVLTDIANESVVWVDLSFILAMVRGASFDHVASEDILVPDLRGDGVLLASMMMSTFIGYVVVSYEPRAL